MELSQTTAITVHKDPSRDRLEALDVFAWPIWAKEASTFPWTYEASETCYFLEGNVIVTPDNGAPVEVEQGDLVVFPAGMRCTWEIRTAVRKHYSFDS
ncbi:MAG: cupin domain-containing protein [Leptolyngbyaceae cyanobacterium]